MIYRLLYRIRCPRCGGWFGQHDPLVLHSDGRTDDTRAMQNWIDTELGPLPIGAYRTTDTLHVPIGAGPESGVQGREGP